MNGRGIRTRALALLLALILALPLSAFAEAVQPLEAEAALAAEEIVEEALPGEPEIEPAPEPDVAPDVPSEPAVVEDSAPAPEPDDAPAPEADRFPEEAGDAEDAPDAAEPALEEASDACHPVLAAGEALAFAESKVNIGRGESYRPALSAAGAGTLYFESSKPGVFSVDSETGEITGIKTGKGVLTVSAGSQSASVPVQVYAAPKKFSLNPGRATLGVGEELVLEPKLPSKTAGHIASCRSSDEGVAAVEGHTIRAVAEGEATITAELFNGKQATCAVTVLRAPEAGMMYLHTPMGRDNYEMGVDETMQITLSYPEGYAGGYTFRSSDESVISIDAHSGRATAHSMGRATIFATAYNGVQDQREFTVKAKPGSLSIQSAPKTMGVGEEFDLIPELNNRAGEECGGGATYRSSKPGVVQVLLYSGYAHLVAKKTGKSKITVTTYNKLKKSVTITVKKAPTEIEIEPDEVELGMGESGVKLKPVFTKKGSFANVHWSSENPDVVRVDAKGELMPVAPGSTWVRGEITIKNADGKRETLGSSSYITVKPAPAEGQSELVFPQEDGSEKLTLGVGETMRAELVFGNGAGGGRKFKSSKKSVATVDASGLVKGKKAGKATITATMYNGVKMSKTIRVVNAPKKIQITNLPPAGFVLRYGEQWDLDVKITDKKKKAVEGVGYTFEDDDRYAVHIDPNTGVVTGNSFVSDTAEITVKTYNGKKARVTIRVGEPEDGLDIYNGENKRTSRLELTMGRSEQLHVGISFTPEPQNVKWWSDKESVARVEDGRVTGVSEGSTFIYASADDPNEPGRRLTNYCYVTVEKPVYGIALDHSSLTLTQGQRATLTPTLTGLDGVSASSIRWESSDARVASVSNGEVEALSRGTATITASLDDPNAPGQVLKAECRVTVERAPFGIALDQTELKLMAGQRATLTATLTNLPGASLSDVTWRSSDDGVATVQAGSVKAVAEGSATITASIEDPEEPGSILQAKCAVTVEKATYGIFLDRGELTLYEGGSAALTASLTGFPEGEEPEVSWSSSRDGVATVQGGTVSAVAPGTAAITASATNPLDPEKPLTAECAVTVQPAFALSAERLSLTQGDTATLTATLRGEAIPSEDIRWTSGRDAVATVQNGLVTAVAGGAATILASCNDDGATRTAQCQVSVDLLAWQEPPRAEEPKVTEDGRVELSWEPSGDEGASDTYAVYEIVDGVEILRGTVTGNRMELSGVTAGEHTYVVRPRERRGLQWVVGESSETVTVTVEAWAASPRLNSVEEAEMGRVALSWSAVSGAQRYAVYELASDDTLTKLQEVSGTSVTLSGVRGGWHRYAVRTLVDGKQGNLSNVLGADVTSLKLDRESAQIEILGTVQLSATLNLPAGADQALSWKSSDPAVANVDGAGLVTGVAEGTATITATCSDGSAACCQVTVYEVQKDSDFVIEDGVLREYNGTAKYVVIPEGVTKIESADYGSSVFKNNDVLKGVVIPYGVKEIKDYVFYGCSNLTSVTIPNSVTRIWSRAFQDCSSLTSITIPDSMTSIEGYAFVGCSGLTNITIPNSVTSINERAFQDCSSLTSITIPNSVTSIGEGAFQDCSSLTSITIPNSVTSIEQQAFQDCSSLMSIMIPNSVTSIEKQVFYGCSSLTSITIPNSVTSIGHDAFTGCSSLSNIKIPNSVTSIGAWAFQDCSSLTSITIPNGVTSIESYAFGGCSSLTSITIPNSVTSIKSQAFDSCSSLTSITIPNSVTSIGTWAFQDCSSLMSITIPNSVTSIDRWAFNNCSSLMSITFLNSRTEIVWDIIPTATTIICYPGSAAEAYAKENGNPIQYIGGQSDSNVHLVDGTLTAGTGMLVDLNALLNAPDASLTIVADDPNVARYDNSTGRAMLRILAPGETNVRVSELASVGQTSWVDTSFALKVVGFEQAQRSIPVGKTTSQSPVGISGTWSSSNESVATVDQSGTVTGVSNGAANIIITRSDGLWASYTVTVGDAATAIAASPAYMFLGIGESGRLSSCVASGFACTGITFESADQGIARVDAQGNVTGVSTGRTQVFVISADDLSVKAACDVAVASEGLTGADMTEALEELDGEFNEWVNAHGRFEGHYVNKEGKEIPAIDLTNYTDSLQAQIYDKLGANYEGAVPELTRDFYIVEQIMSDLSIHVDDPKVDMSEISELLSDIGFVGDRVKDFFYVADLDENSKDFSLKLMSGKMSAQKYQDWFDENMKGSELEEFQVFSSMKKSIDIINGIFEAIVKYARYSCVDKAQVKRIVEALRASGNHDMDLVAELLDELSASPSNLAAYIAVTMGYKKVEGKVIDLLKDVVMGQLKSIPVVGWFFKGAEIGMAVGFAISDSGFMNVAAIQAAAFEQQYATHAASSFLPRFKAAYAKFRENPLNSSAYEELYSATMTYSRFLAMEHSAYAEFASQCDESEVQKMLNHMKDMDIDYRNQSGAFSAYANKYRTSMTIDLRGFREIFDTSLDPEWNMY